MCDSSGTELGVLAPERDRDTFIGCQRSFLTPFPWQKKVTVMSALSSAADPAGRYVHWGVVQISLTNLLIIVAMVVVFILALVIPFGSSQDEGSEQEQHRP